MGDGEKLSGDDKGAPAKRKRGRPPKSARPKSDDVAKPAKPVAYRVAAGKALTSLRGILKAGDPVRASDFHGGQSRVDQLVASGYLEAR